MSTQEDINTNCDNGNKEIYNQIFPLKQKINELEAKNLLLNNKYESKCNDIKIKTSSCSGNLSTIYRKISSINSKKIKKGIGYLKKYHIKGTLEKIRSMAPSADNYAYVQNRFIFSVKELEEQKKKVFPQKFIISILVPVYNTDKKFLKDMIESVLNQTYNEWELCLADASDKKHSYVEKMCRKYSHHDSRIRYQKLKNNRGISANTNECLKMCTGDYIALLDHDDMLHPSALHEVMNAICNSNADFIYTDEVTFNKSPQNVISVHFKPDFAPDTLIANNYICHFTVFSRKIYETIGDFNSEYDGSQDHDFFLRATAVAKCIAHIPEVLYFWRAHENSTASGAVQKPYAQIAGQKAVKSHIIREGMNGSITSLDICPTMYRVSYELKYHPKVSIIIPNNEHLSDLRRCIDSIINKTSYDNYEIVIVENNSTSKNVFDYYDELKKNHDNIKVVVKTGQFNYSAMNNYGVTNSSGEILLFINNHTMIISQQWIEEMLMYAQREDVGAVGAKLYYPNFKIHHAGIFLGNGDYIAGYYYKCKDGDSIGYMGRLCYVQDLTAVSDDCLMVQRGVFNKARAFDENLSVKFNDIDFCLKLRELGYLNIWTPFSELYYFESLSSDYEDSAEKDAQFNREFDIMCSRWSKEIVLGDLYYNPNFDPQEDCFSCKYESHAYKPRCYKKQSEINCECI